MTQSLLIKYAEIGIKGKNRYLFENALVNQAKIALKRVDGEFVVTKEAGRIYVTTESDCDMDEAIEALQYVFGIVGICPMMQIEDNGFEDLAKHVIKHIEDNYEDKNLTFKVAARRSRKNYPMDSMEINMEMGGVILDAFPEMKVDVHNPDIVINIEIRNKINIYSKIIPGPGGMPVGTAGNGMLLLSGGMIALLQDIWLQNVECILMQYISMHHHTHLKEQNRKLSIWQKSYQSIQDQ